MSARTRTGRDGGQETPAQSSAATPSFVLSTYRALAAAAGVVAPLLLAIRTRRGKEVAERHGERMGRPSAPRPEGPLVWFHAASVGETNAVLPLIAALKAERPDVHLLLTTGTVTSAQLAGARLKDCALHQFIPLDSPSFVRSFLDHWRPDAAVFVESEIWPNFVLEMGARDIPLILVNGSLSERSFRRWRKWPSVSRSLLGTFRLVLAQNAQLAQQFAALGAADTRAVGNLKMDAPPPPVDDEELARLRAAIGERPVFLAASTHAGEEESVAEVHGRLRETHPDLLTIIVPRHPLRAPEILSVLQEKGIKTAQRSRGALPDEACGVYLADTIGELGLFYALAPIAFIGGSLTARGGHNPIEALKLGTVVLTGPGHANFADAYGALLAVDACAKVSSTDDFAATVDRLLTDEAGRQRMQAKARQVIEGLSGALGRTLEALMPLLPAPPSPQRTRTRRAAS